MIVDCETCRVRGPGCGDCVVTVLLGHAPPERAVELDEAERAAIGVLADSGLVPPLRLVGNGLPASSPGPAVDEDTYDGRRAHPGSARAG